MSESTKPIYLDADRLMEMGVFLVPREMDDDMLIAFNYQLPDDSTDEDAKMMWEAMRDKAPVLEIAVPKGTILLPHRGTDEMMEAGVHWSSHDSKWEDVYSAYVDVVTMCHLQDKAHELFEDIDEVELVMPSAAREPSPVTHP